jgi:hypothetical protein
MPGEIETLALHLLRALYDSPDSLLRQWRMPEELDIRGRERMGGRSSRPFHLPYRCRPAPSGLDSIGTDSATLAPWQI